jgi:hypothetical protein
VFLQPLGDVLRLMHRQPLQSIPDFRDCAHARTLGSPTRFANPNYPDRIWVAGVGVTIGVRARSFWRALPGCMGTWGTGFGWSVPVAPTDHRLLSVNPSG